MNDAKQIIAHQMPAQSNVDQACVVPYRRKGKRLEICLVTSSAGHWLFPKGFVSTVETIEETALREAYEEAGIRGCVVGKPLPGRLRS